MSRPRRPRPPHPPGPAATTAGGGTLNVPLADLGTENLDTILAAPNLNVVPLIYEPLLQYDEKGNLIPWLAESWDMSPDGLLWTFNLRKGVKLTDGDELTAADVKFSIERYASDASTSAWSPMHRQTVDQVEAPTPIPSKSTPRARRTCSTRTRSLARWIHPRSISTRSDWIPSRSSRSAPVPGS